MRQLNIGNKARKVSSKEYIRSKDAKVFCVFKYFFFAPLREKNVFCVRYERPYHPANSFTKILLNYAKLRIVQLA